MTKQKDEQIISLLKKKPRGTTIIELSRITKYSTHTVAIILAKLEGAKKIEIVRAGSAKLHYWK